VARRLLLCANSYIPHSHALTTSLEEVFNVAESLVLNQEEHLFDFSASMTRMILSIPKGRECCTKVIDSGQGELRLRCHLRVQSENEI